MDDIKKMIIGDAGSLGYLDARAEFSAIENEFKKRTIMRIMKKRYDAGLYLGYLKKIEDTIPKPIKESNLRDWIWLTVNPKPDVLLNDFINVLAKLVKRKIFSRYVYVLEQRGTIEEDNLGKGFHAHLLLKRAPDKEYKQTKRQVKNTFKNICNVEHEKVFYWKECRDDFLDDKMEYITAVKTGDGKDKKQLGDIKWRQDNNIAVVYEN